MTQSPAWTMPTRPTEQARCRQVPTTSAFARLSLACGGLFSLLVSSVAGFACARKEAGATCVPAPQALTSGVNAAQYLMLEPWEEQAVVYVDVTLDGTSGGSQCTGV